MSRTPQTPGVAELIADLAATRLPPPEDRRRIRVTAGVSYRRAARALGASPAAVQNWENGAQPRPDKAKLYREFLDALAEATRAA